MTESSLASETEYPAWESAIAPAPGDLRVIQAFVNTRDLEQAVDRLEQPADLARWIRRWNLAKGRFDVGVAELRQATHLREGFRQLLLRNNGDDADPARLKALESVLQDVPLRFSVESSGTFSLRPVTEGWPAAVAAMLTIAGHAMASDTWRRLKACRRDDCQWAFYDASKNRSGKWCAMEGCGDLMKARAYRERLRRQRS